MTATTRKKSILICDDEPEFIEIIKNILNEKYNIVTACNGQEGLFKAQNQIFDLVITDVHMPKVNGLQFIRDLKKSYSPVTIIMSESAEEVKPAIEKLKGVHFMAKPFEEKDLLFLVDKALSKTDSTKDTSSQDQVTCAAQEWLIKEGDFDDNIYWVIQGKFEVIIKNEKDEEVVLGQIAKDEFIGEMGAIEQKPRSASIKAIEDSIVIKITNEKFLNVFEKQPVWLQKLIKALSARLRNSNEFRKHHK